MTTITIQLPDELAQKIQQAGLLNELMLSKIFEDAIRQYGADRMKTALSKAAKNAEAAMTMQEISKIRHELSKPE